MASAPPDNPYSPPTDARFDGFAATAPPPWSTSAIVGFIMSFLAVLAPIGIILGIVGIVRTSGRRRRGKGLAIAAIPIGLIVSVLTVLAVMTVYGIMLMSKHALEQANVLKGSQATISERALAFYEGGSKRFHANLTADEFEKWLAAVTAKHGALQSVKQGSPFITGDNDGMAFNLVGDFVNGSALISVTVGWDGVGPVVDDIEVDGVSAIAGDH
jgi:hypothetical protein